MSVELNSVSDHPKGLIESVFTDPISHAFKRWAAVINFWIYVSCISMALETVEPYGTEYLDMFHFVEYSAVIFFILDYAGNVYFAVNRFKYIISFWGLVDLVSILPTILQILNLGMLQGAKVFRLLRVVRVLRVLKMAKAALKELTNKVKSANPIVTNLRIYFIALFSVLMISSSLRFFVEGGLYSQEALEAGQAALDAELKINPLPADAPPEAAKFLPQDPVSHNPIPEDKRFYTSIPASMWWCIVTLTTTGYGDMFPITFWGRIIAAVTMLLGLVLFGVLMNIVGKTLMVLLFGESADEKHVADKNTLITGMLHLDLITPEQTVVLLKLSEDELRDHFKKI
jgi:voltage-gated potassium channel